MWYCGGSFIKIYSMSYVLRNRETFPQDGRKQLIVALWKDNKSVLSMIYDVLLHTARLESNGIKRLFMVYLEGKRQQKIVFKNEYGFDAAVIDSTVASPEYGCIEVYEKLYYYNLSCFKDGQLSVYENIGGKPLISFAMQVTEVNTIGNAAPNRLPADYFNCLLMAVCWYLQLPVTATELINTAFSITDKPVLQV